MAIEFRELRDADDLVVLPAFEHRVWGSAGEAVSVNMLVATIIEGGMAIGAFDGERIVGAVYGFATREPEVLHSHYMAVDPEYRRHGLGFELKQRQRTWCLANAMTAMRWTYDPLQLANGHLNLRVLGARGISYHRNHYGNLGGINGSLPSDRLTVQWELVGSPVRPEPGATVVVPDFGATAIADSSPEAHRARQVVREQLGALVDDGWQVTDIDRAARTYVLSR